MENFLISIPKWFFLYKLKDLDYKLQIFIILGILYSSITFSFSNKQRIIEIMKEFGWFSYVKRLSLIIGFISYCFMYYYRKPVSSIIFQWILFVNVLEAGILGIQNKDYILGALLIFLSPFSPYSYFTKDGTSTSIKGSIFQKYKFINNKLYFRLYLSILSTLSLFGNYFIEKKLNIFAFMSCIIPLILNEIDKNNEMDNFSIRTSSIIIGSIIDSTFADNYINKSFIDSVFLNKLQQNTLLRNSLHFICITIFAIYCFIKDKKFTGQH